MHPRRWLRACRAHTSGMGVDVSCGLFGACQANIVSGHVVCARFHYLLPDNGIVLPRRQTMSSARVVLVTGSAGGIGLELSAQIMELGWSRVAVILLAIIATVIVSEWVSAKVRHAII